MNWRTTLQESLASLTHAFGEGELAYLSLTSKAEHAVRDRLAFALHRRFETEKLIVAREWASRFDLAIISTKQDPQCIIELKSYLSCDVQNETRVPVVPQALAKDRAKLAQAKLEFPSACLFQLLLLARPTVAPSRDHDGHVKYGARLRQNHVATGEELRTIVRRKYGLDETGHWSGGSAFGIEVDVHYWLLSADAA